MDERILAHERIVAPGARPERWLFVLHGIYGMGRNWRSVARRTVDARPDWGAVLVDLREHGGSKGFAPPHTIAAAADDLRRLVEHLGVPGRGILGHSFGGKAALAYARDHGEALERIWLVDSTPAARPPGGSAWTVLGVLRRVPGPFASRGEAVARLEAEGVPSPVARWLTTNLERADDEYRWGFDVDAMEALLRDFFRVDLWDVVEAPPPAAEVHVVKATESSVLDDDARARVERAARRTGRVFLHRVEGGHWLNADNPAAVEALLERHL